MLDWSDGDFAAYIAAAKRGDTLAQAASLATAPDAEASGLSLAPAASLAEETGKPKLGPIQSFWTRLGEALPAGAPRLWVGATAVLAEVE